MKMLHKRLQVGFGFALALLLFVALAGEASAAMCKLNPDGSCKKTLLCTCP